MHLEGYKFPFVSEAESLKRVDADPVYKLNYVLNNVLIISIPLINRDQKDAVKYTKNILQKMQIEGRFGEFRSSFQMSCHIQSYSDFLKPESSWILF